MAWIVLTLAGLFEIGWAVGLKYTAGFTRLWPTLWTAASMAVWLPMETPTKCARVIPR